MALFVAELSERKGYASIPSVQRGLRKAGIYVNYDKLIRVLHISERLGLITIAALSPRKTDGINKGKKKKKQIKISGRIPQTLLLVTEKGIDFFEKFHTLEDSFKKLNLDNVYETVYSVWSRMRPDINGD